jgi:GTPase SAR1 family protein
MITEKEHLDESEIQLLRSRGASEPAAKSIREKIWNSVDSILNRAEDAVASGEGITGLALGHVQSGKTTSMISLLAGAHDAGYRIVIGFMGTNENLLMQNSKRILQSLDIVDHGREIWYTSVQNLDTASDEDLKMNIEERGRTALILIMKNTSQINKVTALLSSIDTTKFKALIIDDEADQVSLNTLVRKENEESPTFKAIREMRSELNGHLYLQYTATPYANVLLTPDDALAPDYVELLVPGDGYTGGRAFFIENKATIFRNIGGETMKVAPGEILPNMERAIANFFVGAALMIANEGREAATPISMLINPHQKNLVQEGYLNLLKNKINEWKTEIVDIQNIGDLPKVLNEEYVDLTSKGVAIPNEKEFIERLKLCFHNFKIWLMNQSTSGQRVKWKEYDLHILLGANKLDRGFTVEGLTVTYMNRKASDQVDTMQQRSRAFGYRPFLQYCRVFTTKETQALLEDTVHTEDDLRQQIGDWQDSGRSFKEWAQEIGIVISSLAKPTRANVVKDLTQRTLGGWEYLLNSNTDDETLDHNEQLIKDLGADSAELRKFGKQNHRVMEASEDQICDFILKWHVDLPIGWDKSAVIRAIRAPKSASDRSQKSPGSGMFKVVHISEFDDNRPRTRNIWSNVSGIDKAGNLLQGSGQNYPGDRYLFDNEESFLQIHKVSIKAASSRPLYFLAINLGKKWKNVRLKGDL